MTVGSGFQAGFGGCFGVLAAVLALGFGLMMCSTITAPRSSSLPAPSQPAGADFGAWRLSYGGGGQFTAAPEVGQLSLVVICSRARPDVFAVSLGNAPAAAANIDGLSTFTIDGTAYRVRVDGVSVGANTSLVTVFDDSQAGLDREDRIGRALLAATHVEWTPPSGTDLPVHSWRLTPEHTGFAEEARSRCG